MNVIANGKGYRKQKSAEKSGVKYLKLEEELSLEEKIEKCENINRQLKQEATDNTKELHEAKFKKTDLESRLRKLYCNCQVYNIKHKIDEIQGTLKMLDEQHDAEMQQKRLVFEVNKLSHKLKHERNSLSEEIKIQRTKKCFISVIGKNHQNSILTASEAKTRIPWFLVEIMKSKESIRDISQVLHDELAELGKRKEAYNKEARGIQRKLDAIEKHISLLQGKLEDLNSREKEVSTYLLQLKNTSGGKK